VSAFVSRLGIGFMRAIAPLPLGVVRMLGAVLGALLYAVVVPRRRVARRNLALCFPHWSGVHRERVVRRHFRLFAQAWLDRSWLWHADPGVVRNRVRLTGEVQELRGAEPVILFAPHFLGLDAGVTAITQQQQRPVVGVYTQQSNPVVDAWMFAGRRRFGAIRPMSREEGVRELIAAVRGGDLMYLLPDMDFGVRGSVFVPFYGVPAATVPSLPRFASLAKAKVVPVITQLTQDGYEVRVLPAWEGYPGGGIEADAALMNERLQGYIDAMPEQYYWVHKRFKTRPEGEPGLY
jgi:KDO2-lipid IV(A) lauroyltransferase